MNEACGIFGVVSNSKLGDDVDIYKAIHCGLISLQHRGQESAGIVTSNGTKESFIHERGRGLVSQVFHDESGRKFEGANCGVGHVRYSTKGAKTSLNCIQPYVVYSVRGQLALAHNGELVNAHVLRKKVLTRVALSTDTDSELIAQLIGTAPCEGELNDPSYGSTNNHIPESAANNCPSNDTNGTWNGTDTGSPDSDFSVALTGNCCKHKCGSDWPSAIRYMMRQLTAAYSLVVLTSRAIYAVRDPYGNRPLVLGRIVTGDGETKAWVACSESCAFHSLGATLVRDVCPGEIVEISREHGFQSLGFGAAASTSKDLRLSFCIFEYVYFARPDSIFDSIVYDGKFKKGQQIYHVRNQCGRVLGAEAPLLEADPATCVVSTVPDSATPAALGYSCQTKIPYLEVLHKSRYEGRTFIQPSDSARKKGVSRKFAPLTHNFAGKRIVLVDDSIVRGNTMRPVVALLKSYGAKEVHIRIACPPIRNPCYMGINIPTRSELIANRLQFPAKLEPGQNLEEFANYLNADSVCYLTLEGLERAVRENIRDDRPAESSGFCTACLSGDYPVVPLDIESLVD